MKLFSGVKGKILVGTLSVGLLVGGTSAAASANDQTFGQYLSGATKSLIIKMGGWAGLDVQAKASEHQNNIKANVSGKLQEADAEIYGHLNWKVDQGNNAIKSGYNTLAGEIDQAKGTFVTEAKAKIDATVEEEVDLAIKNLKTAAMNEAQAYANEANNRWARGADYSKTKLLKLNPKSSTDAE